MNQTAYEMSLFEGYFKWWYGRGLREVWLIVKALFLRLFDTFSFDLLFKTLFAPWKRDIVSGEGLSLNDRMRAHLFNLISRLIGFIIRSVILVLALAFFVIYWILAVVVLLVWLGYPLIILALIYYGIILAFYRGG